MKMKMKKNKHIIQQYLKEITAALNCPKSVKAVYASDLKNDILNYLSDNDSDSISINELYDKFGTPEDIADGFYDKNDYKLLLKKAKRRAALWMFVSIFAIIFVVLIIMVVLYASNELSNVIVSVTNSYSK